MSQIASKAFYESELNDWVNKEKSAINLISSIGDLLYNKSIELVLFRNPLVDQSVSEILSLHQSTGEVTGNKTNVEDTSALAKELVNLNVAPSKIDIGKLASEWSKEKNNFESKTEFLNSKLGSFKIEDNQSFEPRDVVLYGFGRIGRLAARELIKQAGKGQQLRLRAIIVRNNSEDQIKKRASLLRMDSVHGPFPGTIIEDYENKTLNINGQLINIIQASHPSEIDYTQYGINDALVIDNTGVFTDKEALSNHLKSKGVKKVLLTAPGKEIPNIVYGINQKEFNVEDHNIFSAASCTTNAISPILKVIEDNYGVEKGHIETVHAYTNDQNLLDNYHKKPRRGRSAAVNMVITSTGAGKAVTKVIPSLAGKLTANAVRVPTPNGSLAIMNLTINKEANLEDVNSMVKKYAMEGDLVNQIKFSIEEELVSNDIIGNTCCSVFDSHATIVSEDKKNVVLYVWYDNEFGYTKQVIRLAKHVAGVRRLLYY
ncbi:glyceraldehyde-3-phosphate dehydrogenase [Flavobacteriales bacterium]|nr:glyceraldehyde-3-phosphate dehydrogenase [Flavobacteriales bacterium]